MIQSAKRSVRALVSIAKTKGIEHVVFSPGSRNAPLVIGFGNHPHFKNIVIPDERSAAYVAIGLAQATGKSVLMCCTSGTAAVNYYPAIAEAFYQKLPIVAITADRPPEWIDQGDGQTIRQSGVFSNHVVYQVDLIKDSEDEEASAFNELAINQALNEAMRMQGPVHINMPFEEPLYSVYAGEEEVFKDIAWEENKGEPNEDWEKLAHRWQQAQSKLILIGQSKPGHRWDEAIEKLSQDASVMVMNESTSNVRLTQDVKGIDRLINTLTTEELKIFTPELLLTFGDAIVSKKIKAMLRTSTIQEHWHVGEFLPHPDTFQKLTASIAAKPVGFLSFLANKSTPKEKGFGRRFFEANKIRLKRQQEYLTSAPFSDLKVFEILLKNIPKKGVVHLANSSVIRYVQLFDEGRHLPHYSNRGTAGIDGSTSTALGFALVSKEDVFLITGDISFFYDSNAFFNNHVPANLKVVVINNQGGNIFTIIPGPDSTGLSESFFESPQKASIRDLAKTFGVEYLFANDENSLKDKFDTMKHAKHACILEIKTPGHLNAEILNNYFNYLKNGATQLD